MKRKLLSIAAALCFIAGAKAQTSYGFKAGVNFPKLSVTQKETSGSFSSGASTNFYVTGFVDAPIASNLSIQPGLSLQGKGSKSKDGADEVKGNIMYLELPVNFVYYVPAGSGNIFLGAGPYAAYALSAKNKINGISTDVNFGNGADEDGVKRFDAGLNFLLGYKLSNGFLINGGYGLGLTNIVYDNELGLEQKNRVFSVGVGYQF
ncbi:MULTISPECIES: porin family protein [unclassified Sphingobacterium]|uniref:porin family protein n=1 Tax=unclassified Sphingobacterium TaxID=2609468 RepID=UPI0025EC6F83|nr:MULTISPECIES: porin family protein [unclassified Sphingobacterium]